MEMRENQMIIIIKEIDLSIKLELQIKKKYERK